MGRARQPERPIARWYWVALGVVLGIGLLVMVLVAIVNPTIEVLTGLATAIIPIALAAVAGTGREIRKRRRKTPENR